MAAPTLTITKLSETEDTVTLLGMLSDNGTADMIRTLFVDISEYTIGGPSTTCNILEVWWTCHNLEFELYFDATTDDKGLYMCEGTSGHWDFSSFRGIPNPKSGGYTGDILLCTYGITQAQPTVDNIGCIILKILKIRY